MHEQGAFNNVDTQTGEGKQLIGLYFFEIVSACVYNWQCDELQILLKLMLFSSH
jgi:hypothetical protein